MRLLLDTHTIVHHSKRDDFFPEAVYQAIDSAENEVFVSVATAAELACLSLRNRLQLGQAWEVWLEETIAANSWIVLPVTLQVMIDAYKLPAQFHADPADRVLVATARVHGLTLITADRAIREYPHVRTFALK